MKNRTRFTWITRFTIWGQALATAALTVVPAWSLPEVPNVAHGQVEFEQEGNTLIVNQSSGRAVVNYGSFDIAVGETVLFRQPGSSGIKPCSTCTRQ